MRNASGQHIKVADIVLKEKMKDQTRKGGKLNDQYNTLTYTVVNITKTGDCVLMLNKSKEVLKTHCPLSQVKKFTKPKRSVNDISPDRRTEDADAKDNSADKTSKENDSPVTRMDESPVSKMFKSDKHHTGNTSNNRMDNSKAKRKLPFDTEELSTSVDINEDSNAD